MFDKNKLIGLEISKAKEILKLNGFKNIEIILNAKHNDKCDTNLVCAVRETEENIILICGEFLFDVERGK